MPDIVAKGDPEYLNLPTFLVGLVFVTLVCTFFFATINMVVRRRRLWSEEERQRLTALTLDFIAVTSGVMAVVLFVHAVRTGTWAR